MMPIIFSSATFVTIFFFFLLFIESFVVQANDIVKYSCELRWKTSAPAAAGQIIQTSPTIHTILDPYHELSPVFQPGDEVLFAVVAAPQAIIPKTGQVVWTGHTSTGSSTEFLYGDWSSGFAVADYKDTVQSDSVFRTFISDPRYGAVLEFNGKDGLSSWDHYGFANPLVSTPAVLQNYMSVNQQNPRAGGFLVPKLVPTDLRGSLFVGTRDTNKGVVRMSYNDAQRADPIWQFNSANCAFSSSPLLDFKHETVIIGGEDGSLYCLSMRNGSKIWNFSTSYPIYSTPAFVYTSQQAADDEDTNEAIVIIGNEGEFLAVNATNGSLIWTVINETIRKEVTGNPKGKIAMISTQNRGKPAIDQQRGVIFISTITGCIVWIDAATGIILKNFSFQLSSYPYDEPFTSLAYPLYSQGILYASKLQTDENKPRIVMLSSLPASGFDRQVICEYPVPASAVTGAASVVASTPAISTKERAIFFGTESGAFFSLGTAVCKDLSEKQCNHSGSSSGSVCRWCWNLGTCIDSDYLDCSCPGLSNNSQSCTRASAVCQWVKDGVINLPTGVGPAYCSQKTPCFPLTCEAITLGEETCRVAGCVWDSTDGYCKASNCFTFWIPTFVSQPYILYFLGWLKDILVLMLIGLFGDNYLSTHVVRRNILKLKKKFKGSAWSHLELRVGDEGTNVYVCDKFCRNDVLVSFNDYCERICEDFFVPCPTLHAHENEEANNHYNKKKKQEDNNNSNDDHFDRRTETDSHTIFTGVEPGTEATTTPRETIAAEDYDFVEEEYWKFDSRQKMLLLNAVAHSIYSDGLWIDGLYKTLVVLRETIVTNHNDNHNDNDDDEHREKLVRTSLLSEAPDISTSYGAAAECGHRSKSVATATIRTTTASKTNNITTTTFATRPTANMNNNNNFSANNNSSHNMNPTRLRQDDFKNAVTLQKKVDQAILQRATCLVYYTQSRSKILSVASAMNSFPTVLQIFSYTVSIIVLFVAALRAVLGYDRLAQIASGCTPLGQLPSTSISGPAYWLIGWRFLNASIFSTAVLVTIKTTRAIYQNWRGLEGLSLQQRLPLMVLYSSRSIHVMLFIYIACVVPFAFSGFTYGTIAVNVRCLIPIMIGFGGLAVDSCILFCVRMRERVKQEDVIKTDGYRYMGGDFGDVRENSEYAHSENNNNNSNQHNKNNNNALLLSDGDDDDEKNDSFAAMQKNHQPSSDMSGSASDSVGNNSLTITSNNQNNENNDDVDENNTISGRKTRRSACRSNNNNSNRNAESRMSVASSVTRATLALLFSEDANLVTAGAFSSREVKQKQTSVQSASPIFLGQAFLVFLLTEAVPTMLIALALQTSFNYAAILTYADVFALSNDADNIFSRDYNSRSMYCIAEMFERDLSSKLAEVSSYVPFM